MLKKQIESLIEDAVKKAYPEAEVLGIFVEYPAQQEHGDYSCNIGLRLSKQINKPPREVAEKIAEEISSPILEKVEIAGPGFINLFISSKELEKYLEDPTKIDQNGEGRTVVIDYGGPNIAKPLGIHHLLSTIIGQSLCNIYRSVGFDVAGINHIGDWGTQFGKLICAYKKWGDRETIEKSPISELQKLYVRFHDEAEKNPKLEDEGREEFRKFEEGDTENHKLWKWFVDESLKEIDKTYGKLGGIEFTAVQGESFYEDMLGEMLDEGKGQGVFVEGEEGAYIVEFDDDMAPLVVQKKDGTTLYSTRDFATMKYRLKTWHPEKVLYVVDVSQAFYFKQLFKALQRFEWYHDEGVHVLFGRMHMKDGKMSTRKGNVILLDEVLDEAVERAKKIIMEKNPDHKNIDDAARVLGIGAVKYNALSQNRTTDITFDWDNMLSLDGNSAPYLQYTYARAKSILRQSRNELSGAPLPTPPEAATKTRAVLAQLPQFAEQLDYAAKECKPNILTAYLFDFAQVFNAFYNCVPVLRASEHREFRLSIVEAASEILKTGLDLLGIEVVEEM